MRLFLEESTEIALPFEAVSARFSGEAGWLGPLASAAQEEGESIVMRVGPSWAFPRAGRKVRVTLGPPHDRGGAVVVPVSWRSSEHPALFPVLDGDIEVSSLDEKSCRLRLAASYEPPFGEFGATLDRALLHRVARSTATSFLTRIAAILESQEADGSATQGTTT